MKVERVDVEVCIDVYLWGDEIQLKGPFIYKFGLSRSTAGNTDTPAMLMHEAKIMFANLASDIGEEIREKIKGGSHEDRSQGDNRPNDEGKNGHDRGTEEKVTS